MRDTTTQAMFVAGGAIAMFLIVFELSRRGLLSLRYALGWITICALLLVGAIVTIFVGGVSDSLPFTPTGFIAAVGLGFLMLIALQLSVSLSGHQEIVRELAEAIALLEERLACVERDEREHETPRS